MRNELVKVESLMEKLTKLIFRKENLKKECFQLEVQYVQLFGDLQIAAYEMQVDCIRLKKKIAYIIRNLNYNELINYSEMENYLDDLMKTYYETLERMLEEKESSQSMGKVSEEEWMEIKYLYRKLAKMIHPDLHPNLTIEQKKLWERLQEAYVGNRLDELKELEILVSCWNGKMIENSSKEIEKRIEKVQIEIREILCSDSYELKNWIYNQEKIDRYKERLLEEIDMLKQYFMELQKEWSSLEKRIQWQIH